MIDRLHGPRKSFPAGRDIVLEGQANRSAYILEAGWACSYKLLSSGERQIVAFHIPGDCLGMRSILFHTAGCSIETVTRIEASVVNVDDMLSAFDTAPRLAAALLWAASRDEAMVVERLVGIGRRDAKHRVAHFLLELGTRLKLVGLSADEGYNSPLTQYMLADSLGLTSIHVNRVLRQLREDGLVSVHLGAVTFLDYDRLVAFAEFDLAYLEHDGPPMN